MDHYLYILQDRLSKMRHQLYFIFLVLFLLSGLICLIALRNNNATMVKLRDDVYTADKNNGDVETALNKLRTYVYAHMNTNLSANNNIKPPIQLQYTYERLQAKAQAQVNKSDLYIEAKNYCEQQIPASISISGRGRIDCVQNYVLSHGGQKAPAIPVGLYEFDFVSPSWSPDLAGWSLITTMLFAIAAAASFLLSKFTRLELPTI
jgi:hypothetical protein